ncbi:MAG: iron-containing alcohol dehydrogenase family protein [Atopobiaceae bacterium]|jgi:glycerol dehydrogenase|nr:iron-containing alcohol dehydrogenase family protein [Atopobiaceae bacterium]
MTSNSTYTMNLPSYTVGADAYSSVARVTQRFGTSAALIGGHHAMAAAEGRLREAIKGTPLTLTCSENYGEQATHAHAAHLAALDQVKAADMIFGMGGGRAIDTCKEVAAILDKPLFSFPTVASNCAPVTAIAVFYKDDGSPDKYFIPPMPPVHSFIDTDVISQSPDDYFWAGIGDAFSKEPEVELSSRDLTLPNTPLMGRALSHACGRPLFDHSVEALADKRAGRNSYELSQVVLDIIVSTGLVSNMTTNMDGPDPYYFNSTTAHAFYNAYSGMGDRAARHLHGEVVSFGVMVLRAFDARPDELRAQAEKNHELGLPVTLSALDCSEADLDGIVERAQTTNEWGRAPYGYTPERFRQAILDADAFGRALESGDDDAQAAALEAVTAHKATEKAPRKL